VDGGVDGIEHSGLAEKEEREGPSDNTRQDDSNKAEYVQLVNIPPVEACLLPYHNSRHD
jgi:hypothetical protein